SPSISPPPSRRSLGPSSPLHRRACPSRDVMVHAGAMRISEVARAAGCSVRAVRHYHASGALPEPPRTAGGYRDYGLADLAALLRVRALVDAGITLADIRSDSSSLIDAAL